MYGNKKKTLREISKNPENMTEEEKRYGRAFCIS